METQGRSETMLERMQREAAEAKARQKVADKIMEKAQARRVVNASPLGLTPQLQKELEDKGLLPKSK